MPKRHVLNAEPGHVAALKDIRAGKVKQEAPITPGFMINKHIVVECGSCGERDRYVVAVIPTGESALINRIECGGCGYGWDVRDGLLLARHGQVNHRFKSDRKN